MRAVKITAGTFNGQNAWLHKFLSSNDKPRAIVELIDGEVVSVLAQNIKFITPYQAQK